MLRHTAVQSLVVRYVIADGQVQTLPASDVQVYYHAQYGGIIIAIRVDSDKNMNALKAAQDGGRYAYIPGSLPLLGLEPVADLLEYLARETPPSGGKLFAFPDKKGRGFAEKPTSTFNSYLKKAYRTAHPDAPQEWADSAPTAAARLWPRCCGTPGLPAGLSLTPAAGSLSARRSTFISRRRPLSS